MSARKTRLRPSVDQLLAYGRDRHGHFGSAFHTTIPYQCKRMQTSHGYRCMVVGKDPRRLPPRRGSDGSLLHLRPAAGRVAAGVTEDALDPERRSGDLDRGVVLEHRAPTGGAALLVDRTSAHIHVWDSTAKWVNG